LRDFIEDGIVTETKCQGLQGLHVKKSAGQVAEALDFVLWPRVIGGE
jgi:hypothetical protein